MKQAQEMLLKEPLVSFISVPERLTQRSRTHSWALTGDLRLCWIYYIEG